MLIGLDIMLEWREFFKEGVPVNNMIRRKIIALKHKTDKVRLNLSNGSFNFANVFRK